MKNFETNLKIPELKFKLVHIITIINFSNSH